MKFGLIEKLYNLKNLTRYNMTIRIRNESVAEHSYFVAMFTEMLCSEMKVSDGVRLLALEFALMHDVPEAYTSDIPHPVKENCPALAEELKNLENEVMKGEWPDLYPIYVLLNKNEVELTEDQAKAKLIVEMADILSVLQYTNSEMRLGNSYVDFIHTSTCRRFEHVNNIFLKVFRKTTNLIY